MPWYVIWTNEGPGQNKPVFKDVRLPIMIARYTKSRSAVPILTMGQFSDLVTLALPVTKLF